jgi:pimeloyl-ACP methyl ester carboxylesterase
LNVPTLIITGRHDFIPVAISEHIAGAIPNARLVTLEHCGHFAFLECAPDVRKALSEFFRF